MAKRLTKKEIRRDPVYETLVKGVDYITRKKEKILWGVGGVVLVAIVLGLLLQSGGRKSPQAQLRYLLALSQMRTGDTLGYFTTLQELVNAFKDTDYGKRALYHMGYFYLQRGVIDSAEIFFNRFLRSGFKDALLLAGAKASLASIALEKGEYENAKRLFLEAYSKTPYESMKALYLYKAAITSEIMGKYDEALNLLKEFEEKFRKHPLYGQYVLGEIKFLNGYLSKNSTGEKPVEEKND